MISWKTCISVGVLIILTGCQGGPPLPFQPRNVVHVGDFHLEMKWCTVSSDRNAECLLEMRSLQQDKKAGLAYPTMQDDKGKEHRMTSKDTPIGGLLMVAKETYTTHLTATNLPAYTTHVRSVAGTFVAWLPDGTRVLH